MRLMWMMDVNLRRRRGRERRREGRMRGHTAPPQGWPRSDAWVRNITNWIYIIYDDWRRVGAQYSLKLTL